MSHADDAPHPTPPTWCPQVPETKGKSFEQIQKELS